MIMPLPKKLCDFERCGCRTSIVDRNGRDGIGKKKSLRHVPLLVLDIGTADE